MAIDLFKLIPRRQPTSSYRFEPVHRFGRAPKPRPSPSINALEVRGPWLCYREHVGRPAMEDEVDSRGRVFRVGSYCGAPAGVRCGCQKVGHDPGDEG
jgi:hypothetical protein